MLKIKNISLFFGLFIISAYLVIISLFAGCTLLSSNQKSSSAEKISHYQRRVEYIDYIKENQKNKNKIYSQAYGKCEYFVDSDTGVTLIQNLINPALVYPMVDQVISNDQLKSEKVFLCYKYILNHFKYFPMPEIWPSVDQTIKMQKGDCKGFSLLLLSILISFDIECYAAISNSHMWVEAKLDGLWRIFETDSDSDRALIYKTPGFYKNPMFKIYYTKSEKRIRMKGGKFKN